MPSVYTTDLYVWYSTTGLKYFHIEQYLTFECHINVEGSEDENQMYENINMN